MGPRPRLLPASPIPLGLVRHDRARGRYGVFLADVAVDYRVTTATVPVLSNSSVADGMQGQELDVALTIDSDVALQASTITPTASIQFADYTFTTTGLSYYVLAERGVGCAEGGECGKP